MKCMRKRKCVRKRSLKQEPKITNSADLRNVRVSTDEPDLTDEDTRKALAEALVWLDGLKGGLARKLSASTRVIDRRMGENLSGSGPAAPLGGG